MSSTHDAVYLTATEEQNWNELARLFMSEAPLFLEDDSVDADEDDDYSFHPESSVDSPYPHDPPRRVSGSPRTFSGGLTSFLTDPTALVTDCAMAADFDDAHLAEGASVLYTPGLAATGGATTSSSKRRGGRKKGSKIQCEESLLLRLLPLGTKEFNEEIKTLRLCKEEIKKLKFARRRIKNAKAADKRRCKISDNITQLQQQVEGLMTENDDLIRRLRASQEEVALLRKKR